MYNRVDDGKPDSMNELVEREGGWDGMGWDVWVSFGVSLMADRTGWLDGWMLVWWWFWFESARLQIGGCWLDAMREEVRTASKKECE